MGIFRDACNLEGVGWTWRARMRAAVKGHSKRILSRQKLVDERFIHHRHGGGSWSITLVNIPPEQNGNAHGCQEPR
jgi:hypothetical protein